MERKVRLKDVERKKLNNEQRKRNEKGKSQ